MRLSILIAFMAIFGAQQCYSSKILMLFPSPSRSHLIVTQAITQELARRGHSVTIVSSFPLDKPLMNHNDIFIESIGDFHTGIISFRFIKTINVNYIQGVLYLIRLLIIKILIEVNCK